MQYFDFVQFHCILLTIVFAFDNFDGLPQNFSLAQTGLIFGNFRLVNGKNGKSQHH
jgi:hypothetical protein